MTARSTRTPPGEVGRTHDALERVLTMIPYLYENARVPIREVAARFDLSEQEVTAVIDRIATLGDSLLAPHQLIDAYIEDGFVGMDLEPAVKRPIRLTAKQAFALLVGEEFLRAEGLTITPALSRAVEKVRRATSDAERDRLGDLERVIGFEREGFSGLFRTIERARARRERVEIEYLAEAGPEITRRRIDPYLLWNHSGAWYCAAWCHLRRETRTFRISRIRTALPTGEHFEIHADFDAPRYGDGPVYVPAAGDVTVRVRFRRAVARYVEERWGDEIVERAEDGSVIVARTARSESWIVKWVLPYGAEAEILEPESARAALREVCRKVLDRYPPSDRPSHPGTRARHPVA
jgi:proteasome accessory factor C